MKISDFVARGLNGVKNDMGETRNTRMGDSKRGTSIVFPNGWVASIIDETKNPYPNQSKRFSIAVCDYNGYFDWKVLIPFGANNDGGEGYGCFRTDSEDEVCRILTIIENFR